MNQHIYNFIYIFRDSGLTTFAGVVAMLTLFFSLSGVFETSTLPAGFTTRTELIGQLLILIIMPAYLGMGTIFGLRRSLQLAQTSQQGGNFDVVLRSVYT